MVVHNYETVLVSLWHWFALSFFCKKMWEGFVMVWPRLCYNFNHFSWVRTSVWQRADRIQAGQGQPHCPWQGNLRSKDLRLDCNSLCWCLFFLVGYMSDRFLCCLILVLIILYIYIYIYIYYSFIMSYQRSVLFVSSVCVTVLPGSLADAPPTPAARKSWLRSMTSWRRGPKNKHKKGSAGYWFSFVSIGTAPELVDIGWFVIIND